VCRKFFNGGVDGIVKPEFMEMTELMDEGGTCPTLTYSVVSKSVFR
jgi:hypothetical protein